MRVSFENPVVHVDDIREAQDKGQEVLTSPHVGSLGQERNPHYLTLADQLRVGLVLVNTATVNDRHGLPLTMLRGGQESQIEEARYEGSEVSRRLTKYLLPRIVSVGDKNLEDLHIGPLDSAGLSVQLMTDHLNGLGDERFGSANVVRSMMRDRENTSLYRVAEAGKASHDPKKRISGMTVDTHGVYGSRDVSDESSGLIPDLRIMTASWMVRDILEGREETHHIGGSDMTEYMQDGEFNSVVSRMAERSLIALGVTPPNDFRFVIYNKNGGIDGLSELSGQTAKRTGIDNFSQHDLSAFRGQLVGSSSVVR